MARFDEKIPAPVHIGELALLDGLNLQQLRAQAEGDPKTVNGKLAHSDLAVLRGLKDYLEESWGSIRNEEGNFLATLR